MKRELDEQQLRKYEILAAVILLLCFVLSRL